MAILKFPAKLYHYYFCSHVEGALNEFSPQVVIYNAGTDIMEGDSLGLLSVTKQVTMFASLVYDNVCPVGNVVNLHCFCKLACFFLQRFEVCGMCISVLLIFSSPGMYLKLS